jgi:actin-related protein
MEKLWEHTMKDQLDCEPEKTPLAVVEGDAMNPRLNREKMTQMAFETFHVPSFYLAPSPAMILKATGRYTGLSVDIGSGFIRVVPVYETYCLRYTVRKQDTGSYDLRDYLACLLCQREDLNAENTTAFRQEVQTMLKQYAYVA